MFQGREICGSVVGPDAAFVVAKDHVHDPVQVALFVQPSMKKDLREVWLSPNHAEVIETPSQNAA